MFKRQLLSFLVFVALIVAILFCTLFYKFKKEKVLWVIAGAFYIINCMGTAYYYISVKVPVLSSLVKYSEFTLIRRIIFTGVPFFALGAVIYKIDKEKIQKSKLIVCGIVISVLYIFEKIIATYFKTQESFVVSVMLPFLVGYIVIILLRHPMEKYAKISEQARICGTVMYYVHPGFIFLLQRGITAMLHTDVAPTVLFVLTVLISTVFGYIIGKTKICKKII